MAYKTVKKDAPGRGKVDILGETYEAGARSWKAGTKS
jgi:hypothetical protein